MFTTAVGENWALAKSQSLHLHRHEPFQIPSAEENKIYSRKAKSQTQKGVAHREKNNTKPNVSLVKSLLNIPNIMLLDYDISWGGRGRQNKVGDVGEGITVK